MGSYSQLRKLLHVKLVPASRSEDFRMSFNSDFRPLARSPFWTYHQGDSGAKYIINTIGITHTH